MSDHYSVLPTRQKPQYRKQCCYDVGFAAFKIDLSELLQWCQEERKADLGEKRWFSGLGISVDLSSKLPLIKRNA